MATSARTSTFPALFGNATLAAAAQSDRPNGRLFTVVAAATAARGNTTALLVETPQKVPAAFLDCHALGATTFLIRGFDPLDDAVEDGRELLSAIRARVAEWLVGAMEAEWPSAPNLVRGGAAK